MINFPLVTVAIPFYNSEHYIKYAIQSVCNQTYTNWELILLDDGSTDHSLQIAKSYVNDKIRVYSDGENKGLVFRLNQSVLLASGEYYARMDADDIMHPDRLYIQMNHMLNHKSIDVLGTSFYSINRNNEIKACVILNQKCDNSNIIILHPSIVARKVWLQENPYDMRYLRIEDTELWLRTVDKSRFENLSVPLMYYREFGVPTWKKYMYSQISSLMLYFQYQKYKKNIYWSIQKIVMSILKMVLCTLLYICKKMDLLVALRKRNNVEYDIEAAIANLQKAIIPI